MEKSHPKMQIRANESCFIQKDYTFFILSFNTDMKLIHKFNYIDILFLYPQWNSLRINFQCIKQQLSKKNFKPTYVLANKQYYLPDHYFQTVFAFQVFISCTFDLEGWEEVLSKKYEVIIHKFSLTPRKMLLLPRELGPPPSPLALNKGHEFLLLYCAFFLPEPSSGNSY